MITLFVDPGYCLWSSDPRHHRHYQDVCRQLQHRHLRRQDDKQDALHEGEGVVQNTGTMVPVLILLHQGDGVAQKTGYTVPVRLPLHQG